MASETEAEALAMLQRALNERDELRDWQSWARSRIAQLEHMLGHADAAKNEALESNDKLRARVVELEAEIRDTKEWTETKTSHVANVLAVERRVRALQRADLDAASALEDLQQAGATLKTALDTFRAAAIAANEMRAKLKRAHELIVGVVDHLEWRKRYFPAEHGCAVRDEHLSKLKEFKP